MKREIEIKAKVKDLKRIALFLKSEGCVFEPLVHQEDTIYFEEGKSPTNKTLSDPVLRIRRVGLKSLLTYKHSNSQDLDKTEYESEVSDPESLDKMLFHLGFEPVIVVDKTRATTKYRGFTLCLDKVKNLGEFVEIEKIADEDATAVQEEMKKIFSELGIDEKDFVYESYDKTIWKNKL